MASPRGATAPNKIGCSDLILYYSNISITKRYGQDPKVFRCDKYFLDVIG